MYVVPFPKLRDLIFPHLFRSMITYPYIEPLQKKRNCNFGSIICSPDPKAHRWAYSIGRHPSSVRGPSSAFSNGNFTEAMKLILTKFHIYYLWAGGTNKCVFCSNRIRTLVAMATCTCHWIIREKVETGIYCCLTADIFIKVLQKWCLRSPLPIIRILYKPLNLIGWHGNRKAKFAKKCSKIFSEAVRGMKLKLCRNFHNISLYKIVFLLSLLMGFRRFGNLKFPYTFNGKSESRPLFVSHCRYFDKSFTKMFIE